MINELQVQFYAVRIIILVINREMHLVFSGVAIAQMWNKVVIVFGINRY